MEPSIFGFFYYFVVVWVMALFDIGEVFRKLYVLIGCSNDDVYLYCQIKIAVKNKKVLLILKTFL